NFTSFLEAVAAWPERELSALSLLSDAERHRLLVEWNDTAADYPREKCIQELFAEQAEHTPEATAGGGGVRSVRYGELNAWAEGLAAALCALGVRPGAQIGLSGDRSIELIAGMLGILKAGCCYVPLDPQYPSARLQFMAEDAGLEAIVVG